MISKIGGNPIASMQHLQEVQHSVSSLNDDNNPVLSLQGEEIEEFLETPKYLMGAHKGEFPQP